MSKARLNADTEYLDVGNDSDSVAPFAIPDHSETLLRWLDEQPMFVPIERTVTLYRHDRSGDRYPEYPTTITGTIERYRTVVCERTKTEHLHIDGCYEQTSRKSHSSQGDVMEAWEDKKFPTHNVVSTDRGAAAELYTLSSYTEGIDGPTVRTRRPFFMGGGMTEAPGVRYECSECNTSSKAFNPERRSTTTKYKKQIEDHIEEAPVGHEDAHVVRNEGSRATVSEKNFYAHQYRDGAGRVVHYDRTAAIRSRHGVVMMNKQDFAKGRARVTRPSDYDANVPLSGIMEYLDDKPESVYDVTEVETAEVDTHSRYRSDFTRTWYVLHFGSGAAFAVVYDETAKDYHERRCGFYFPADETTPVSADTIQTQLRPVEVSAFLQENPDADIVGSNQFSQAAGRGGSGKFYDPDLLGENIVRQGEWYFIPLAESLEDAMLESGVHDPDEQFRVHQSSALPRECETCDGSTFHYREDGVVECDGCGSLWFTDAASFAERSENPLGSHRPNELVSVDGNHFVRGMIRHDTRDHNAINFDDVWHLAVDNGRDGLVFDTSTPDNTSGRTGDFGSMRVE